MKPTFIVLTDLSPAAHRAAHLAALLAAPVGGQLHLLYLEQEPVFTPEMGMVVIPEDFYTQEKLEADAALAELARTLPVPATASACRGSLHDVLGELISERQPQLLVMALYEEHDLLDALLLDQALPVLRDSGLPVLLVPECAAQNPGLPALVAVAADGEGFRLNAASQALGPLLRSWPATYCVVHVAPPDGPDGPDGNGLARAQAAVCHTELLPALNYTTYEVKREPPSLGLVQAALDLQADLVILFARPRTFVCSVFNCGVIAHVAHACPVPMLLLPTQELTASEAEATTQYVGQVAS
ncbi:hypothetical protein AUC43_17660 [Hymenobacter sedentarius]|uniref:UspA domain-containing protein n=1 Tax=Hymenobacter sedentarius TaxID=1411621 RepID=A0A0U4C8W9_9BACT|nr:universal stress protein [Hymenobacter sedentarius]ALW86744.1 hypothetical protein AUC43_17660 [Hymenobacter sedentarius]